MNEIAVVLTAATVVILAITAGALFLMWNVARKARCRYCDHCRREEQNEEERKQRERHGRYHQFHHVPLSSCSDPDCPGRNK